MSEIKYDVFAPKTRADWFITTTGMIRKNFCNWTKDGDFPLPGVRVCVFGIYNEKYDRLAEFAEPNWDAYCRRHGLPSRRSRRCPQQGHETSVRAPVLRGQGTAHCGRYCGQ